MKRLKVALFWGVVAVAVVALDASGPMPPVDAPPEGGHGPWQSRPVPEDGSKVQMHYPDFDAAIPRTEHIDRRIPETSQRDVSLAFSSSKNVPAGRRGKRPQEGSDGDAEAGFLDSWLLPDEGGEGDSTGWGWLADSVSGAESESQRTGEFPALTDGTGLDDNARYRTWMHIEGNIRRELDLDADDVLFDYDIGQTLLDTEASSPGPATSKESGWVSPSWR